MILETWIDFLSPVKKKLPVKTIEKINNKNIILVPKPVHR